MLFTRCPDCDTTFRVTDETLKMANGQVRCGRCASVFNAYAEVHQPPTDGPATAAQMDAAETSSTPTPNILTQPAPRAAGAERTGAASVPDTLEPVEIEAAENNAATGKGDTNTDAVTDPITAREVQEVLATDATTAAAAIAAGWQFVDGEPRRHTGWWSVAAVFALVTLGLQGVHHFRTALVGHEVLGPLVQQAYGMLGTTLIPNWDVRQYEILDWVATAEPNARGQGALKITARIQNRGPRRQPYPAVQLRLKDRWEAAVGSRVFAPTEYLDSATPRGRLMTPGETVRAQIEVVDPGPDAYGFELDVCIKVETDVLSCGTDEVFL